MYNSDNQLGLLYISSKNISFRKLAVSPGFIVKDLSSHKCNFFGFVTYFLFYNRYQISYNINSTLFTMSILKTLAKPTSKATTKNIFLS